MRKSIWMVFAAVFALCSCATEEVRTGGGEPNDNPVEFSEKVEQYAASRAMDGHPIENVPDQIDKGLIPIGKSFGVYAWVHNGSEASAFGDLQNKTVTRGADDGDDKATYTYTPTAKWPTDSKQLSFLAYYPQAESDDAVANGGFPEPEIGDAGTLILSYDVPLLGEKHIDVMFARKGKTSGYAPVGLEFHHALSRMKFSAMIRGFEAGDLVRITGIKLKGAILSGSLELANDSSQPAWALDSGDKGDITVANGSGTRPNHLLAQNLDEEMRPVITATGIGTTAGDLIILPQQMSGLSLEITTTINGEEGQIYLIPLTAAPPMEMNQIYDYRLILNVDNTVYYDVEVLEWNEGMDGDVLFDGQFRLKVNKNRVEIPNTDNGFGTLGIFTDYFESNTDKGWTIEIDQENDWITASSLRGNPGSDSKALTQVSLGATSPNMGHTPREGWITVKAGNMSKKVYVSQDPIWHVYAAPGVIGIKASELLKPLAERSLTLKGSGTYADYPDVKGIADREFGGLEDEPVYTVYYKWGSKIAVLGGHVKVNNVTVYDTWSVDDVAWVNPEFTGDIVAYADFTSANTTETKGEDYDIVDNPEAGHGDPCADFGDGWHTPSGVAGGFKHNGDLFFGTSNLSNNPFWTTDIPVSYDFNEAIIDPTKSVFLPNAGDRDNNGVTEFSWGGRFWSTTAALTNSYMRFMILTFKSNKFAVSVNTSQNISTGGDMAHPIRCVKPASGYSLNVTPTELVFESWFPHDQSSLSDLLTVTTDNPAGWEIDTDSFSSDWMTAISTGDNEVTVSVIKTYHGLYTGQRVVRPYGRTVSFDIVSGDKRKTITVLQKPGGILASPGVLGIGMESGNLTMRGSREFAGTRVATAGGSSTTEFGPLANETVYTTLFKWGSLIATNSILNDGYFTADDIVWAPAGYKGSSSPEAALTAIRTEVGNDYTLIPYGDDPNTTTRPTWPATNAYTGLGDPCTFADGGTFAAWKVPTVISSAWNGMAISDFEPYGAVNLGNGISVNGVYAHGDNDLLMFFPLTGERRDEGIIIFTQPIGYFWSSSDSGGYIQSGNNFAYNLFISSSQISTNFTSSDNRGLGIRCVKPVPKATRLTAYIPLNKIPEENPDSRYIGGRSTDQYTGFVIYHPEGSYRYVDSVDIDCDVTPAEAAWYPMVKVYKENGTTLERELTRAESAALFSGLDSSGNGTGARTISFTPPKTAITKVYSIVLVGAKDASVNTNLNPIKIHWLWGGENHVLYFGSEGVLSVGRWRKTADMTLNNLAYFKWGSVVGSLKSPISNWNSSAIQFNPTAVSYSSYSNIPIPGQNTISAGSDISQDTYHNGANILQGKGDPCRLVGFSSEDFAGKSAAEIDDMLMQRDQGWRSPSNNETYNFIGGPLRTPSTGYTQSHSATQPFTNNQGNFWGDNEAWFPVVQNESLDGGGWNLPLNGSLSYNGYRRNEDHDFWTNQLSPPLHDMRGGGYLSLNALNYTVSIPARYSAYYDPQHHGLAIRCVKPNSTSIPAMP